MNLPAPRARRRARIEIIPLIDIVFFLLATFVMVSLSMVKNQGIAVRLPAAETGSRVAESKEKSHTAVTITEKGDIYFNKKKVSFAEMSQLFQELKAKEEDPTVILNGDERALLGRAILVLDEARKRGIKKFAIQTKQPY